METRTDKLRRSGDARPLNDGDLLPFVRWPRDDSHAYIEGQVQRIWEGDHGRVCVLKVRRASSKIIGAIGTGVGRHVRQIGAGDHVHVGLDYVGLSGVIGEEQVGKIVHIAFTKWVDTAAGRRCRRFEVYEL